MQAQAHRLHFARTSPETACKGLEPLLVDPGSGKLLVVPLDHPGPPATVVAISEYSGVSINVVISGRWKNAACCSGIRSAQAARSISWRSPASTSEPWSVPWS